MAEGKAQMQYQAKIESLDVKCKKYQAGLLPHNFRFRALPHPALSTKLGRAGSRWEYSEPSRPPNLTAAHRIASQMRRSPSSMRKITYVRQYYWPCSPLWHLPLSPPQSRAWSCEPSTQGLQTLAFSNNVIASHRPAGRHGRRGRDR